MLAGGTVAVLTCGVVQHLLDSLQGIKPLLLGWLACHHMVPRCCDPTCLFDHWSRSDAGRNLSKSLDPRNDTKSFVFFSKGWSVIFYDCAGGLKQHTHSRTPHTHTHTELSFRQAFQWLAHGIISACVNIKTPWMWILFAAGHILLDESNPLS